MHPARSRSRASHPLKLNGHGTASVARPIPSRCLRAGFYRAYGRFCGNLRGELRWREPPSLSRRGGGDDGDEQDAHHQPEAERMYGESQADRIARIVDHWQRAIVMIRSHVEKRLSPWGGLRWLGQFNLRHVLRRVSGTPPKVLQSPHGRTEQPPMCWGSYNMRDARAGCGQTES
jgi:hypothetical protein